MKRGDFFCCQGCFSSFYCSRSCQNNDWIKNHNDDCKDVAANLLQEAALRPPDKDELDCWTTSSHSLRNRYRCSLKKITFLEKEIDEMKDLLEKADEDIEYLEECKETEVSANSELRVEIDEMKAVVAKLKKEKAGKASAFVKLKRKNKRRSDG